MNDFEKEYEEERKKQEKHFQLVQKGVEFEKNGDIDKAIAIYEKLAKENFEGSHVYNRLAILYRKNKDYLKEQIILSKAVFVFTHIVHVGRGDRIPKLNSYQEQLNKSYSKHGILHLQTLK